MNNEKSRIKCIFSASTLHSIKKKIIIMCRVICLHLCMGTMCMTGFHGSQKKAGETLKLKLEIVNPEVSAGN